MVAVYLDTIKRIVNHLVAFFLLYPTISTGFCLTQLLYVHYYRGLMKPTYSPYAPEPSVIMPACNEESGMLAFLARLHSALSTCFTDYEVIIVNDGSMDKIWALTSNAAARFSWLRCLHFMRNFGKEAAMDSASPAPNR